MRWKPWRKRSNNRMAIRRPAKLPNYWKGWDCLDPPIGSRCKPCPEVTSCGYCSLKSYSANPDVLLLDEPPKKTISDLFSIRWLEGYLQNYAGIMVVSSHDRNFLNAVCDHIIDVDRESLKVYKGNYDQFLAVKVFYREQSEAIMTKQDKKKEHLQEFIDRFGPKHPKPNRPSRRCAW